MQPEIRHQNNPVDPARLGLLPGMALVFGPVLVGMAALALEAWWISFSVVALLLVLTAIAIWIVYRVTDAARPGKE